MFEIHFVAPVAVRFEDEPGQPRVFVVGEHPATELELSSLSWPKPWPSQVASFESVEASAKLCCVSTRRPILLRLEQKTVDFLFTTSTCAGDIWRVTTTPDNPSSGAYLRHAHRITRESRFRFLPSNAQNSEVVRVDDGEESGQSGYDRWTRKLTETEIVTDLPFHIHLRP